MFIRTIAISVMFFVAVNAQAAGQVKIIGSISWVNQNVVYVSQEKEHYIVTMGGGFTQMKCYLTKLVGSDSKTANKIVVNIQSDGAYYYFGETKDGSCQRIKSSLLNATEENPFIFSLP